MSTYTQLYYHLVFSSKNREPVFTCPAGRGRLQRYIWTVLKNKDCHPYAINGVDDHIHIFTHVHPSLALASLIKTIKLSTSDVIKRERLFPAFTNWQSGYGGFTESHESKSRLIHYVLNQEEHHETESFKDEFKRLLKQAGIEFDERYLD